MSNLLRKRNKSINPLWALSDEFNELSNTFDKFFHSYGQTPFKNLSNNLIPSMNVVENKSSYEIEIECPGVKKDDIQIVMDDTSDILVIKGEKKHKEKKEDCNIHIQESSYGKFQREITIPKDINKENIDATFTDGILNIIIPKTNKEKIETHTIPIKELTEEG